MTEMTAKFILSEFL